MNVVDTDVSILVVDDAKLPCITIHKALTQAGYHDIRTCHTAADALNMVEQRAADILLADWCMPEMDGLELTKRVRLIDEELGRYTAVIVITAMDRSDAVAEALSAGADDFIHKSPDQLELVARVANAARISRLQNTVLQTMKVFAKQNSELVDKSAFDPTCGAYIKSFFLQRVQKHIENVQARGGAVVCMMLRLTDAKSLQQNSGEKVYEEAIEGLYQRIKQLVRPIDEIARVDSETFAVKVFYNDAAEYRTSSYNRVLQQLNMREIKTSKGYVPVNCIMSQSVFVGNESTTVPTADELSDLAESALPEAAQTKTITLKKWS